MNLNPHIRNKVDLSTLSQKQRDLLMRAGRDPGKVGDAPHINALRRLNPHQRNERKYFDSGDYAMSKAGKASAIGVTEVGHEHPSPEKIPHCAAGPDASPVVGPGIVPGGLGPQPFVRPHGASHLRGPAPAVGPPTAPPLRFAPSGLRPAASPQSSLGQSALGQTVASPDTGDQANQQEGPLEQEKKEDQAGQSEQQEQAETQAAVSTTPADDATKKLEVEGEAAESQQLVESADGETAAGRITNAPRADGE